MNIIIGNILIGMGVFFTAIGIVGIFRFKDLYSKLMASSKIDTVALITIIIGVAVRSGISWFTLKVLLILLLVLFVNPIITSKIALSIREDERMRQANEVEEGEKQGES